MKHLFRNRAFRLPMLLVLVVFALIVATPTSSFAKTQFTIGANATEGDPTDGLDFVAGGSGLVDSDKSIEVDRFVPRLFLVPPIEFGGYWAPEFYPEFIMFGNRVFGELKLPAENFRRGNK